MLVVFNEYTHECRFICVTQQNVLNKNKIYI